MESVKMLLVTILVSMLACWPLTTQAAEVSCSTSACTTFQNAAQNNTLSTAVINDAAGSWVTVYNQVQTNSLTTTSLSAANANLQTFFDYLNSNGWVDYMNQALAANRSSLTTNGATPTESQITSAYTALVKQGMTVTMTQVQNALTVTPSQAQEMYAALDQGGGWAGLQTNTVRTLSNVVTKSGGGHPVLDQSAGHPGMAHLLLVVSAVCMVSATAVAVFGLWALFPPVTVFAGILAIGFGVVSVAVC
jgi:hypothetical protein